MKTRIFKTEATTSSAIGLFEQLPCSKNILNLFPTYVPFLPIRISLSNQRFADIFRWCRNGILARNRLMSPKKTV